MAAKNSNSSTGAGAAPIAYDSQRSKPSPARIAEKML